MTNRIRTRATNGMIVDISRTSLKGMRSDLSDGSILLLELTMGEIPVDRSCSRQFILDLYSDVQQD